MDAGQKALEQLRDSVKKDKEAPDKKKVENDIAVLIANDQLTATLRPEGAPARLEVYEVAIAKLRDAEKGSGQQSPAEKTAAVAAAAKLTAVPRQEFIDDIKLHTDILKKNLSALGAENDGDASKGIVDADKPSSRFLAIDWPATRLEWLDWATRWGMLLAGGCVLAGLFTRLACLGCASFLMIEILSNTAFPWLPVSPKSEGNYTFINKNVVELFALLTLMTLPTGRWLGLDALVSRLWPFRKKESA